MDPGEGPGPRRVHWDGDPSHPRAEDWSEPAPVDPCCSVGVHGALICCSRFQDCEKFHFSPCKAEEAGIYFEILTEILH